MYLYAVLTLLLAALALACPPPYKNMDCAPNSTHTSSQIIKTALAEQGLAWVKSVTVEGMNNERRPWARDKDSVYHTIPYCYHGKALWDTLKRVVDQAFQDWLAKLGTAGKENGHTLRFAYWPDEKNPQYCYKADKTWNEKFPKDSLIIHNNPYLPFLASSTVGWQPYLGDNKIPNRMMINPEHAEPGDDYIMVHEVG
jgi:hypothetical protein